MSDHEGDGLDLERWEEASLPGGSAFSYAASEVFNQGITQGNSNSYQPTGPRFGPQGGVLGPRGNGIPVTPLQGPPQRARFAQYGHLPPPPRQPVMRPPVLKSTAHLQAEKGQPPNGQYEIGAPVSTWRNLVVRALRVDRAAQPHPKQVLRQIMARTETFIKEPEDRDQVLYIWGQDDRVGEAKGQFAEWVQDVLDSFPSTKPGSWYKGKALDGRAEHREDRQNQERLLKELIQEAEIDYPVEAALLWPKELDIDDFKTANAEVLSQLRSGFTCRIDCVAAGTAHIMIAAQSQADALSLMTRMMNLIKESISRRDQLVTVNMIHIANYSIHRDRVGLLDLDPKTHTYLPTLHGNPAADQEQLNEHRRQVQVSNRKKIKKTIDTAIKKLRISQQHCRMRFVFGELGFLLFQKPSGGAETYTFDDFYTMVTKGRTKLTLNGLPVRQGEITDLPDILNEMDAFSDCTEYYAAFFDFPGETHNTTLRLETVFIPMGDDETENGEKRWVELSDMVSRLQVSHLNFDRPDYQATLDAFPLGSDKLPKQVLAFQANVTMDRPPHGIKSLPRRRVHHPNERGLKQVSELIMLKWRFKNTDGIFELRRKDTYDLRPGRECGSLTETKWHALYYYPEWDNLMGDFASVRPGEDVRWVKSVATFFPEGGEQWTALPQGFKIFIGEVEEIQDLLAEAIRRVAKGKRKTTETGDLVNGVETGVALSGRP